MPSVPVVIPFQDVFARAMGERLPVPPPVRRYWGCGLVRQRSGDLWEVMVTSDRSIAPIEVQAEISRLDELPEGYFMAGFGGHGMASNAFYWCEVARDRRVFFRIPHGNAYSRIEDERAGVLAFLKGYGAFWERAGEAALEHLRAIDSMGAAAYELTFRDGTKRTSKRTRLHRPFAALLDLPPGGGEED
ncbi:MAG: hypothetical protein IT372_39780 [Polyangiaceae bacterium]|nr:hypothetical protein [Polyangiaceae bacterium]